MPVVLNQLVAANAGLAFYLQARALAAATIGHFAPARAAAGLGPGSCCAGVAVVAGAAAAVAGPGGGLVGAGNVPVVPGQAWGAIYGNSQMAAGGLALGVAGGHAERAALTAADNHNLALHNFGGNNFLLFVELTPCATCAAWLNSPGNPYQPVAGHTLNVWWRWVLPVANPVDPNHGVFGMYNFHQQPVAAQNAQVAAW